MEKVVLYSSSLNNYTVELGTTDKNDPDVDYPDVATTYFGPEVNKDFVSETVPYAFNQFYGFYSDYANKIDGFSITLDMKQFTIWRGNKECFDKDYDTTDDDRIAAVQGNLDRIAAAEALALQFQQALDEAARLQKEREEKAAADAAAGITNDTDNSNTTPTDDTTESPKVTSPSTGEQDDDCDGSGCILYEDVDVSFFTSGEGDDDDGMSTGAIIGIISVFVVLCVASAIAVICIFRRKNKKASLTSGKAADNFTVTRRVSVLPTKGEDFQQLRQDQADFSSASNPTAGIEIASTAK